MIAVARRAIAFAGLAALASCSEGGGAGAQALFVVPASLDELAQERFYDHPWPSDLRRDARGAIRLAGVYDPHHARLIDAYVRALDGRIDGFSPTAMGYLRFDGDLDPASLPASPSDTLAPDAPLQIVDVDPRSPERGQRHLAHALWRRDEGIYWRAHTLAVGPALGYPLRPRTTYAVVVTKRARAADGGPLAPSADLEEVLGLHPPSDRTRALHDAWSGAIARLDDAGVHAADVAHLTVFTTGDPAAELFAVADAVRAQVPPPTVRAATWTAKERTAAYDVYEAVYGPSPNYQAGTAPYANDGGDFVFDAAGQPVLQGTFDMRVTFVVPSAARCPMPASGYPVVLYAHGTGGDYRSIVDEAGSVGGALASKCLASIGTDQIFHGARPGAPPPDDPNREADIETLFFNFGNPRAMRTNNRQSAIDLIQEARLFTESRVTVPASIARTGGAIAFDGAKVIFYGHSQGGQNGPLLFAADAQTRGGVLSGASVGVAITLTEKTKPTPSVASAFRTLLQLTHHDDAAELTLEHPILSFAQTVVDPTDPINYVAYALRAPRAGFAPKSVLLTEGVQADGAGDSYAPPHGIEISAVATGLPRMAPGTHPVAEMRWGGPGDVVVPPEGLAGNVAGGAASGVLAQFIPPPSDGHFVIFDVPAAREMAAQFCRNLADDPRGRVPGVK